MELINSREKGDSSEQTATEADLREDVQKKKEERKRIRDERLETYSRDAQSDRDFREKSMESMTKMAVFFERSIQTQERLLDILADMNEKPSKKQKTDD